MNRFISPAVGPSRTVGAKPGVLPDAGVVHLNDRQRRVVMTGIGIVAPTGAGKEKYWSTLLEGRSIIGPITRFDAATYPCRIAGEVLGDHYAHLVYLRTL